MKNNIIDLLLYLINQFFVFVCSWLIIYNRFLYAELSNYYKPLANNSAKQALLCQAKTKRQVTIQRHHI